MKKERPYQYVGVNSTLSFILTSIKQFKFYVIGTGVKNEVVWDIGIKIC